MTKLATGPIPLYHQLEQVLATRMSAGEYAGGSALPSEEQIGREFGVSRITVRKALDALLAQGLIVRRRGIGSFVVERPEGGVHAIHLSGSLDEFLISAHQLHPRVISMGLTVAPDDIAVAFGLTPGAEMLRLELVSIGKEGPIAHSEFFFRPEIANVLRAEDIVHNEPVVRTVERKVGLAVARALQVIEPDIAPDDTAAFLELAPNTPVLRTRRSYFTVNGDLLEIAQLRYHPSRYRYEVELRARPQSV